MKIAGKPQILHRSKGCAVQQRLEVEPISAGGDPPGAQARRREGANYGAQRDAGCLFPTAQRSMATRVREWWGWWPPHGWQCERSARRTQSGDPVLASRPPAKRAAVGTRARTPRASSAGRAVRRGRPGPRLVGGRVRVRSRARPTPSGGVQADQDPAVHVVALTRRFGSRSRAAGGSVRGAR